jgi:hypothetical protein
MDAIEVLVRLIEGAVENSARRRQQQQQRTPILYRPPQQTPQQPQQFIPPQLDPRVALQRAGRASARRVAPAQSRVRRQSATSNVRTSTPPPVPSSAAPAKIASPAPPAPSMPTRVDARALHRWLTPATLRRQFMLTEVLQPPIALRDHHLE